jgi:hypothetical protein
MCGFVINPAKNSGVQHRSGKLETAETQNVQIRDTTGNTGKPPIDFIGSTLRSGLFHQPETSSSNNRGDAERNRDNIKRNGLPFFLSPRR